MRYLTTKSPKSENMLVSFSTFPMKTVYSQPKQSAAMIKRSMLWSKVTVYSKKFYFRSSSKQVFKKHHNFIFVVIECCRATFCHQDSVTAFLAHTGNNLLVYWIWLHGASRYRDPVWMKQHQPQCVQLLPLQHQPPPPLFGRVECAPSVLGGVQAVSG